jgi:DNA-binding NarL/FixJ family response regulator
MNTDSAPAGTLPPMAIVYDPRALIAAAHALVVERHGPFRVRATCTRLADAFALLAQAPGDVLVMSFPERSPSATAGLIATVKEAYPATAVVYLCERRDRPHLAAVLRAGADACVSQLESGAQLGAALAGVYGQRAHRSPLVLRDLVQRRRKNPRRALHRADVRRPEAHGAAALN